MDQYFVRCHRISTADIQVLYAYMTSLITTTFRKPTSEEDYLDHASIYRNKILGRYLPTDFNPATFTAENINAVCMF